MFYSYSKLTAGCTRSAGGSAANTARFLATEDVRDVHLVQVLVECCHGYLAQLVLPNDVLVLGVQLAVNLNKFVSMFVSCDTLSLLVCSGLCVIKEMLLLFTM